MLLMAQLSRWLDAKKLDPAGLTPERVEQFLTANRARGHRFPKSSRGVERLVAFLRANNVIPAAPIVPLSSSEQLVERFRRYLVSERGLTAGTIVNHLHAARLFLKSLEAAALDDMGRLESAHVHGFILAESQRRSVASAKCVVVGLRSLLRFLHVEGITEVSLAGAVPTVSGWTGTWLPRGVDSQLVRRLLAGCDRASAQGCRDYAVLIVLARLGMRVGEVAALQLGDIDWHGGEVLIRGKAQRLERLPLPVDVGRALADYVQTARPAREHGALFLRVLAPHRGLTSGGLIAIVKSACARAGVGPIAAHRLRHTVASDLLRAGAGLPEIGQLLRHRSMASTAIYAKVDTVALRALARPWPGAMA
jgi:site-specific recombinase XerD